MALMPPCTGSYTSVNHFTSNISTDVQKLITVACPLLFLLSIMKDFVSILVDKRKCYSSQFQIFCGLLQKIISYKMQQLLPVVHQRNIEGATVMPAVMQTFLLQKYSMKPKLLLQDTSKALPGFQLLFQPLSCHSPPPNLWNFGLTQFLMPPSNMTSNIYS